MHLSYLSKQRRIRKRQSSNCLLTFVSRSSFFLSLYSHAAWPSSYYSRVRSLALHCSRSPNCIVPFVWLFLPFRRTSLRAKRETTTTAYIRLYILEIISFFISPVFLLNLIVSYLFPGLASRLLSFGDWAGPLSSASLTNDVAY